MTTMDLSAVGSGFSDLARGSQGVFRSVLTALSHPGRVVEVACDAELPDTGQAGSAAVLLALLDAQTSLWLSPTLAASPTQTWLRFHTGCSIVNSSAEAQFVWCASLDELPELSSLCLGTDVSPELAATCLIDVPNLSDSVHDHGWTLSGPGIREQASLAIDGVSAATLDRFTQIRATGHALFPCGIDVLLACDCRLVGLPRTTHMIRNGA
jgi:alpha-D-ribose 1-methylphosphonate 5-triphosphate synthase subunit PhnH